MILTADDLGFHLLVLGFTLLPPVVVSPLRARPITAGFLLGRVVPGRGGPAAYFSELAARSSGLFRLIESRSIFQMKCC